MTKPANFDLLTARDVKVLRFVESRGQQEPVAPVMCVVKIEWSDLPKTAMQARQTLVRLLRQGLVERRENNHYIATAAGQEAVKYANAKRLWQTPPPRAITNKRRNK